MGGMLLLLAEIEELTATRRKSRENKSRKKCVSNVFFTPSRLCVRSLLRGRRRRLELLPQLQAREA